MLSTKFEDEPFSFTTVFKEYNPFASILPQFYPSPEQIFAW
jgi:hypothetical protein